MCLFHQSLKYNVLERQLNTTLTLNKGNFYLALNIDNYKHR